MRKPIPTDGFYKSREWWALRQKYMRMAGWECENCGAPIRMKGTGVVDHIVPIREDPSRAFDPMNLQALCHPCHNNKHSHGQKKVDVPETGPDGYPVGSEWCK
jgi:5-methylcytosine-specific restriction endonuclease McrA